jgi:hypothetical protein
MRLDCNEDPQPLPPGPGKSRRPTFSSATTEGAAKVRARYSSKAAEKVSPVPCEMSPLPTPESAAARQVYGMDWASSKTPTFLAQQVAKKARTQCPSTPGRPVLQRLAPPGRR